MELDDIRGSVAHMGEIVAYDSPRQAEKGLLSMRIHLTMDVCHPLHPGTDADNGRGGINYLSFGYHGLPYLYCCFCIRIGHC